MFETVFFLMIRRPPRSTLDRSSAASDVYKRQEFDTAETRLTVAKAAVAEADALAGYAKIVAPFALSLIHISEPTRPY